MTDTHQIGVQMHSVTLNLRCDNEKQLLHTAALLGDHVCAPWDDPDLVVNGTWLVPPKEHDISEPRFDTTGLDAYGKRMHVGDDVLVWTDTYRDKNLQLRFRKQDGRHHFDVVYQYRPSVKKDAKYQDYEAKKYFDLVRYLVFFPIAWHLQRTRGWEMIHASAVADGDRAVLIAGPGGAGKTTTCIALMARAGMRLLTENLVFTDGELVYPVAEPIRLTEQSIELLGPAAESLRSLVSPGGLKHKTMFVPPLEPNPPGVRAALLFLARFASPGSAERLPAEVALEKLSATNFLTLELNDYYWYVAALDLAWPRIGSAASSPIPRLVQSTPCHALGIDKRAGIGDVVERIQQCLHGRPHPVSETRQR